MEVWAIRKMETLQVHERKIRGVMFIGENWRRSLCGESFTIVQVEMGKPRRKE